MKPRSPERARARYEARERARLQLPNPLEYPDDLPISARKDEILAALATSQVLVVAGETGSGKSTQLPKICLEAGRGSAGMIGHTQPRRIAARSIAERVAEELGVTSGGLGGYGPVGYKVRFTDRVGDATLLKVMTDGVLLAELHGDPELRTYDTLIIDEAHERSLNIDFILGYLKRLLPARPDLKLIITSATIDTEKFSRHFDGAPVIEVSGRTYPVEVRYQPLVVEGDGTEDDEALDEVQAVCDAVEELCREGPGDILVFLPGEREIRDTAEALGKNSLTKTSSTKAGSNDLEVLALYGRLSSQEQHRIFEAHTGRRAVLATNVAETSLTVPGIRFVVDLGTARISRYSRRTKVQRLPIERISQASANQRAGRCGRLGPGICVRLYSEDDFASRHAFTEPEILRTNLASVVLQMAAIGLGDIEGFPFVDPPDKRNVKDGVALLEELGALVGMAKESRPGAPVRSRSPQTTEGGAWRLTAIGRKLARLPLDPRLGRMVLEGARLGCLEEVLVITAGLSVQDPRERPADKREAASALHARFADQSSDFMSFLSLWSYLEERQGELSSSQFRRLCRKELISYQRAREWQDIVAQLGDICRQMGLVPTAERPEGARGAKRAEVHQALLSGLLTQVGVREGDRTDFAAPRGARFAIWPGSVAAKKPPRWVMAAELVETGRLWGRVVAPVRPQWVERTTAHLLKWAYSDPSWDSDRGSAVVLATATLYGLPVVARRAVELSRLDPPLAREMFIYHGLVEGDWDHGAPPFVGENRELLDRYRALLQRARRLDLMVGDERLAEFYRSRLGPDVTSSTTFWAWWKRSSEADRAHMAAAPEDLWGPSGTSLDASDFPDVWTGTEEGSLDLLYNWEPGSEDDGVRVVVPLSDLEALGREGLEWQVPGLREELVIALLRSLPKDLRRHLVPIPERAKEFVAKTGPKDGPLLAVLAREASLYAGTVISAGDFDWSRVPSYLRPTFQIVGEQGQVLATGKEVTGLLEMLRPQLEAALQAAVARAPIGGASRPGRDDLDRPDLDRPDLDRADRDQDHVRASLDGRHERSSSWAFGELPTVFEPEWNGRRLRGYPALVDEGDGVSLHVFSDEPSARTAMAAGTRRLLLLNLPSRRQLLDGLERRLGNRTRLALAALANPPYRSVREVAEDAVAASLDEVVKAKGGPARGPESFEVLVDTARRQVGRTAEGAVDAAGRIISRLQDLGRRAAELMARAKASPSGTSSAVEAAIDDITGQLASLAGPRFLSGAGLDRLPDIERYLAAIDRRLEKLPADPRRDFALTQRVQALQDQLAEARLVAERDQANTGSDDAGRLQALAEARWMLEELRVSFFAQSLGTRVPVSEQKILRILRQMAPAE